MHTLSDPEQWLRRCVLPDTVETAEDYLARRLETATLLFVCDRHFAHRFPRSWPKGQEQVLPATDAYSAVELACLQVIDEHLFPFALEYMIETADEGERSLTIPLHNYGIDHWTYGLEECTLGWKILGVLTGIASDQEVKELDPLTVAALQEAHAPAGKTWSWAVLQAVCEKAEPPLNFLVLAIQMFEHATDNLFLDPTEEMRVEDATWCLEDIDLLTNEWKAACVILERTDQLTAWLEADPTHVRKVVDQWNLALWNMQVGAPAASGSASSR